MTKDISDLNRNEHFKRKLTEGTILETEGVKPPVNWRADIRDCGVTGVANDRSWRVIDGSVVVFAPACFAPWWRRRKAKLCECMDRFRVFVPWGAARHACPSVEDFIEWRLSEDFNGAALATGEDTVVDASSSMHSWKPWNSTYEVPLVNESDIRPQFKKTTSLLGSNNSIDFIKSIYRRLVNLPTNELLSLLVLNYLLAEATIYHCYLNYIDCKTLHLFEIEVA